MTEEYFIQTAIDICICLAANDSRSLRSLTNLLVVAYHHFGETRLQELWDIVYASVKETNAQYAYYLDRKLRFRYLSLYNR